MGHNSDNGSTEMGHNSTEMGHNSDNSSTEMGHNSDNGSPAKWELEEGAENGLSVDCG